MAGRFQGSSRSGRGGRWRSSYQPLSDINVTPFVDVMLVLLIVFMVTAPLLTVGVPVDLPKAKAQTLSDPDEPLVVSVNNKGLLFVQDTEVEIDRLVPRLIAITENKPDTRIFVRGDRNINYGRVMEVMATVNSAGFTRVALIAELPSGASPSDVTGGSESDSSKASENR
ncbi:protein TolR [Pelagibius sp. Alg239-R121]|uniref:protein TolR n=1 Tax=Pelagibius sp. Alg239-R121 TaxID=2993448 RepID=UPI0024A6DA64|nr:protein TolR [Pelagibius sp. Alg239-R121]